MARAHRAVRTVVVTRHPKAFGDNGRTEVVRPGVRSPLSLFIEMTGAKFISVTSRDGTCTTYRINEEQDE